MWLSRFWARVSQFTRPRRARGLRGIYSVEQFRTILERERARADRNRHQFSMIVFEVSEPEVDSTQVQHLARVLTNRIRLSDQAGWFNGHRIAVVLPETSADGAWRLANDICQAITTKTSSPEYTVYTYPSKWLSNDNEHSVQLHFADIFADWKTTTSREFSISANYADGLSTGFTAQPSLANGAPNCRAIAHALEPFFYCPLPFWKRAMDIVGATGALIVLSPIIVAVAIAVKLTSKGSVIFKQQRAGPSGESFTFYKFRSMVIDAETRKKDLLKYNERTGPAFKMIDDPRVTRVGDFIRKWSLDELPQLFNVLRGDLSLVGPRPLPIEEVSQQTQWQNKRLYVTPGITCLWQVYARHDKSFDRWVRLDIKYVLRRSWLLDLKILLKTLPAVLSRKGAF